MRLTRRVAHPLLLLKLVFLTERMPPPALDPIRMAAGEWLEREGSPLPRKEHPLTDTLASPPLLLLLLLFPPLIAMSMMAPMLLLPVTAAALPLSSKMQSRISSDRDVGVAALPNDADIERAPPLLALKETWLTVRAEEIAEVPPLTLAADATPWMITMAVELQLVMENPLTTVSLVVLSLPTRVTCKP